MGEEHSMRPTNMNAVGTKKPAAAGGRAPPPPVPILSWQAEGLDDAIALFATGLRILLEDHNWNDQPNLRGVLTWELKCRP